MRAALLFDMDGLLLDTERLAVSAFVEVSDRFGLAGAEALALSLVGASGNQTRERVAQALGTEADHARFEADWDSAFRRRLVRGIPLKPGVADVIPALAAQGRAMVVVTSTRTAAARAHLAEAGLIGHFVDVIGSDRVTAPKPDPAPYLTGADRAGVAATACDAFEDSDRGVMAAVAAGCRVSQVPDLRPPETPFPNLGQDVFGTLEEAVAARGYF